MSHQPDFDFTPVVLPMDAMCLHPKPWRASGEPRDHGACVNRDLLCQRCGAKVGEQSWTAAAFKARKP